MCVLCDVQGLEVYSTVLWHMKKEVQVSYLAQEAIAQDRRSPHAWAIMGNCFSLQKVCLPLVFLFGEACLPFVSMHACNVVLPFYGTSASLSVHVCSIRPLSRDMSASHVLLSYHDPAMMIMLVFHCVRFGKSTRSTVAVVSISAVSMQAWADIPNGVNDVFPDTEHTSVLA